MSTAALAIPSNKLKLDIYYSRDQAARTHMTRRHLVAIDRFIGKRIRERRMMSGLSQRELARRLGIPSQQMIYNYERGYNAVSAGRLYEIASILSTPVDYFFEGLGATEVSAPPAKLLSFMRCLSEIESEAHQDAV